MAFAHACTLRNALPVHCLIGLGDDGMSNNRMFSLIEVEIKLSDYGMVRVTHGCAADADQHTGLCAVSLVI